MSNLDRDYDDQTYGTGRRLDHQRGRLSGDMKQEPLFLRPTNSDFWLLLACTFGGSLLVGTIMSLMVKMTTPRLLLFTLALLIAAFGLSYVAEAFFRWRRRNYRYEMPR